MMIDPDELDLLVTLAEKYSGTPEGAAVLTSARALRSAQRAPDDRGRAHDGREAALAVHVEPGIRLDDLVTAFTASNPDVSISIAESERPDVAVRRGKVSVAAVRLPVRLRGFAVKPLPVEDYVVAVRAGDALAGRSSVTVDDLAAFHLLQNPDEVPEWREVAHELQGSTIGTRASLALGDIGTLPAQLDHVAAGNGIVIVPRSRTASSDRADVVFVPVEGIVARSAIVALEAEAALPHISAFLAAAG